MIIQITEVPVYTKGLNRETVLKAMGYDKKSLDQKNRWVLPVKLGKVVVRCDVPAGVIEEALDRRKR